jgi:hypothetical protein
MSLANALMPVPRQRFVDADGVAYAGGTVTFYETGASTIPKPVFSTHRGTVSLGTIIDLDASGYLRGVYLERGGYRLVVKDAEGTTVLTQDGVSDTAATYFERIGQEWSAGSVVTADHTVLATDFFIIMTSSSQRTVTLPAAAAHLTPIAIKNEGSSTVLIAPAGSDEVEGVAGTWTLPAGGFPLYPTIWLYPDGVSAWWIVASDGCAATDLLERASESMSPSRSQSRSASSSTSPSAPPISPSAPVPEPETGSESSSPSTSDSRSPSASPSPSPTGTLRVVQLFFCENGGQPIPDIEVHAYSDAGGFNESATTDMYGRVMFDVNSDIVNLHLAAYRAPFQSWYYTFSTLFDDGPPWTEYSSDPVGFRGAELAATDYAYCAIPADMDIGDVSTPYPRKRIAPYQH